MTRLLDDSAAVVTGGASGLGREISLSFAEQGADVVVADIRSTPREGGSPTHEAISRETQADATYVECDVTNKDDLTHAVDAAEEFGGVDVMVNNAGMTIIGPAEEMAPEDWRQVVDVDLSGVFYGSQAAGRRMIEQGDGGAIVNVSSMMGSMGLHERTPYCAAKGGVDNMTRTLAVEWAEHGIHVNALAPGYIRTAITDQSMESAGYTEEEIENRTPMGRFGTPEEMANCALFLAARDNFVTGEVLYADGGWGAYGWGAGDQ